MGLPSEQLTQKSRNIQYIECLDQLRGVAALMVFFAHALHNFTRGMAPEMGSWLFFENPLLAVVAEGPSGVGLFMVLSGFLFAYGAYQKEILYKEFVRNRFLRIYPMYILMILLGIYAYPANFSFTAFLASLLLLSNTSNALNGGMFTILLWTISTEFMFYLVFPFLHRMYQSSGAAYLVRLLLLAVMLRLICVGLGASPRDLSYFTILGRIDQFIIGMLAAYAIREGKAGFWSGLPHLFSSVCIVIGTLYALNKFGGGWVSNSRWKVLWHTWEAFMYALVVIAFVQSKRRVLTGMVGKFFTLIGTISFSVYLLHQPVLAVLQRANLRVHDFTDVYVDALITGGLALIVVVALSWLTFTLIERPFMRMRRNYYAH